MTLHTILQPSGWPKPKGYANGLVAQGDTIWLGGQIGWNEKGEFAPDLAAQIGQVLANILAVLAEAGAGPEHVVRLTWYLVSMDDYHAQIKEIGRIYRETMGMHFPAMSVVQVTRLAEADALVEIEATAVRPAPHP